VPGLAVVYGAQPWGWRTARARHDADFDVPAVVSLHNVDVAGSEVDQAASSVTETASQLLARVLSQLSLSAWLPSAALVLLVAFVMELATSVDNQPRGAVGPALSSTFVSIGKSSVGGLVLMGVVIVVVTMLTQAFSFGAIRVMEGYWGAWGWIEWLASKKADRQRGKQDKIATRYRMVRANAIDAVIAQLVIEQEELTDEGGFETFTKAMRDLLEAMVKSRPIPDDLDLTPEQLETVDAFDWRALADKNFRRTELNLEMRLKDYPTTPDHVLPTWLGNVLRRHEDDTGLEEVEHFVESVFDNLPFSLQVSHDEQRTRLDLYCSMVFVLLAAGATAVLRFGLHHWQYQLAAAGFTVAGCWVVYRAAISTARHYGSVLEVIARHADQKASADARAKSARLHATFGLSG
jgi:hypothetical protein